MNTNPSDNYITTAELAARWRVKKGTIEKRRYRGLPLPPEHRYLGNVLYKESEVREFEHSSPKGPRPRAGRKPKIGSRCAYVRRPRR